MDEQIVNSLNVTNDYIQKESQRQKLEIERRLQVYKGDTKIPDLTGFNVIVVDDGIATGSTMKAALASIHKRGAKSVILAIPVASSSALQELDKQTDETISLFVPPFFYAIGQFYRNFEQTSDEEVKQLLKKNKTELSLKKMKNN